jgi:hypothetical protein
MMIEQAAIMPIMQKMPMTMALDVELIMVVRTGEARIEITIYPTMIQPPMKVYIPLAGIEGIRYSP